jgi:hypothetical protein
VSYSRDMDALINIEPLLAVEYKSQNFLEAEAPILHLDSNPMLIDYFAENVQLLYWIDSMNF